ncbi:hypothetical protein IFR05_002624 [Cadophora sp. M221]|nr:hypothetical protein IFR05_002624 [Cadophora sp. M221]
MPQYLPIDILCPTAHNPASLPKLSHSSPPTGFPFNSVYGQPDQILFDGNIYAKIAIRVEDLEEVAFDIVVAFTKYNGEHDIEEDCSDVGCGGPQLVAFVSDDVIRTARQPPNSPIYYSPTAAPAQLTEEHNFFQPAFNGLSFASSFLAVTTPVAVASPVFVSSNNQPIRATTTSMNKGYLAGWLAANSTRAWDTRAMPPRATVTTMQTLQYGFDLTPAVRSTMTFQPPLSHNYFINAAGQQQLHTNYTRPSRIPWEDSQKIYVWELVLLATLQLNRPVGRRDFPAITEALHRQFDNTTNSAGIPCPLRGFNTVHSMVTKHPGWADFVKCVLP